VRPERDFGKLSSVVVSPRPRRARPGLRRRLPLITALALLVAALGMTPWSAAPAGGPGNAPPAAAPGVAASAVIVAPPAVAVRTTADQATDQSADHCVSQSAVTVEPVTTAALSVPRVLVGTLNPADETTVGGPCHSAVGSRAPPQPSL
jgi:hypothetical protein